MPVYRHVVPPVPSGEGTLQGKVPHHQYLQVVRGAYTLQDDLFRRCIMRWCCASRLCTDALHMEYPWRGTI